MTVLPDLQSAEWRHGQRPSTGLCCWESVACVQLRWRTCSVFQVMSCCNWQPRALCSIMCSIKCTYAAPTALHRLQSEGHWLNKHGGMRQQSMFGIPWAEEGGKLKFSFFFKKTKKSLLAFYQNMSSFIAAVLLLLKETLIITSSIFSSSGIKEAIFLLRWKALKVGVNKSSLKSFHCWIKKYCEDKLSFPQQLWSSQLDANILFNSTQGAGVAIMAYILLHLVFIYT